MSAQATLAPSRTPMPSWVPVAGAWLGGVAAAAAVLIGLVSFTGLNPPGWLRIVMVWVFILAWIASMPMDIAGLLGERRAPAITGLALCVASAVAMAIMLSMGG